MHQNTYIERILSRFSDSHKVAFVVVAYKRVVGAPT